MLMHNLQWPEIFLYSEREIIIMHLHSWGHIISGRKVRRRHWAQHRDWVRRDGDPCELFSCAKPGGCGLGLEEIPPAMFSPPSSASPSGCSGSCYRSLSPCRDIFFATSRLLHVLGTPILAPAHGSLSCWPLSCLSSSWYEPGVTSPTATPWMPSLHPFQNLDLVLVARMSLNLSAK